ncbi:MAG: division/cell wall cluster transcriptional repressor MraZ [Deltaproteobacteria bacterium]|nr:division/cell wall cluster transcriptional repressor MraZ [Deltaproteobacteria bacterium]
MFKGNFQHTIDPKGRMSVPTRFRDLIPDDGHGKQLVITWGMTGECLWAYPQEDWEEIEEQIRRTKSSPQKDAFVRNFIGNAHECTLDKMGRILIPPTLREKAGLKKHIVAVGALQKFEIWDQERYKAFEQGEVPQTLAQEFYESEEIRI